VDAYTLIEREAVLIRQSNPHQGVTLKQRALEISMYTCILLAPIFYIQKMSTSEASEKIIVEIHTENGTQTVEADSMTIGELLLREGIFLEDLDRVEPNRSSLIKSGQSIYVTRVEKMILTEKVDVPFQIEYVDNEDLSEGTEKTVQDGIPGEAFVTWEILFENGMEAKRELSEKEIVKESVAQVVHVGRKREIIRYQPPMGVNLTTTPNGKEFIVTATAYTAYCKGCTGITKTGINLIKNPNQKVIAVDPNFIPLGTRVWVEGYGEAIAGDTGGAIKGEIIDVFIPDENEANRWGRKKNVRIRILD